MKKFIFFIIIIILLFIPAVGMQVLEDIYTEDMDFNPELYIDPTIFFLGISVVIGQILHIAAYGLSCRYRGFYSSVLRFICNLIGYILIFSFGIIGIFYVFENSKSNIFIVSFKSFWLIAALLNIHYLKNNKFNGFTQIVSLLVGYVINLLILFLSNLFVDILNIESDIIYSVLYLLMYIVLCLGYSRSIKKANMSYEEYKQYIAQKEEKNIERKRIKENERIERQEEERKRIEKYLNNFDSYNITQKIDGAVYSAINDCDTEIKIKGLNLRLQKGQSSYKPKKEGDTIVIDRIEIDVYSSVRPINGTAYDNDDFEELENIDIASIIISHLERVFSGWDVRVNSISFNKKFW